MSNFNALKPKTREELSSSTRRKLPVKFDERHEQAYQIYLEMGPSRNFKRVAEKMNLGPATIGNWALAYGWSDRLRQDIEGKNDEGLLNYFTKIAAIRNTGIALLDTLFAILKDAVDIIAKAREEKREMTEQEAAAVRACRANMINLGFRVNTGKDLRDLINALGEIVEFQPGSGGGMKKGSQPINVSGGSVLILQGLTAEGATEVLRGKELPNAERNGTEAEEGSRSALELERGT